MKSLALLISAIVATALIAVQHQQLGQLRAENVSLQQSSAEAEQLKTDLAKSTGAEANAEDEIARLREENRDLLKLRNQVYQLREATAQSEQVRGENQRLQAATHDASSRVAKRTIFQPTVILVQNLYDRGMNTPEAAATTFFWAQHEGNLDDLSRCIVPEHWPAIRDNYRGYLHQNFSNITSIEIAACRNIDANTVQLGIQFHSKDNPDWGEKIVLTFRLRNGEWKVDTDSLKL
jgi:myosin heavy subunit